MLMRMMLLRKEQVEKKLRNVSTSYFSDDEEVYENMIKDGID